MKTIEFKNWRYAAIVFLFAYSLLMGCKKDDKASVTLPPYTNTFSAKVNGATFTAIKISASNNLATPSGPGTLIMEGTNGAGQEIDLQFNGYTATTISSVIDPAVNSPAIGLFYEGIGPWLQYVIQARTGNFGISNVDKSKYSNGVILDGNFNFEITKGLSNPIPYTITEGKFSVFVANK